MNRGRGGWGGTERRAERNAVQNGTPYEFVRRSYVRIRTYEFALKSVSWGSWGVGVVGVWGCEFHYAYHLNS